MVEADGQAVYLAGYSVNACLFSTNLFLIKSAMSSARFVDHGLCIYEVPNFWSLCWCQFNP